jgi:hypothetical protein
MPVPVANSYHWGHSMRGLILRPGGTTPIHLRGRPHALLLSMRARGLLFARLLRAALVDDETRVADNGVSHDRRSHA